MKAKTSELGAHPPATRIKFGGACARTAWPLVLLFGCGGDGREPAVGGADSRTSTAPSSVAREATTSAAVTVRPREARMGEEEVPLESMHRLLPPNGARIVDLALVELDEAGMPSTWGQSMRARLLHKVIREGDTWIRIRSRDEVEDFMERERARPVGEQRFGEIRFVLEEGPSDAKMRVAIRELRCGSSETLALVPVGRVGTNEPELRRLRNAIESAIRAAIRTGFKNAYRCAG